MFLNKDLQEKLIHQLAENEKLKAKKSLYANDIRYLSDENNRLSEENEMLKKTAYEEAKFLQEQYELKTKEMKKENEYLKQRVKEFRHKQWFPVYEENLKLAEEVKHLQNVIKSVEIFLGSQQNEKR